MQSQQPPQNPNKIVPPVDTEQQNAMNEAWQSLGLLQPEPPPKDSFFKRNKKYILLLIVGLGFLIILTVVALVSSGGKSTNTIEAPSTNVALTTYDKESLAIKYPASLDIKLDEKLEDGGRYIVFEENKESPDYSISVTIRSVAQIYQDGEEAVHELLDVGTEPSNVVTSEVILGGVKTQKTIAEFIAENGEPRYIVYSSAQSGDQYVTVSGTYTKDNQEITDSLDATLASIKLK